MNDREPPRLVCPNCGADNSWPPSGKNCVRCGYRLVRLPHYTNQAIEAIQDAPSQPPLIDQDMERKMAFGTAAAILGFAIGGPAAAAVLGFVGYLAGGRK